jgi:hypothetical protein
MKGFGKALLTFGLGAVLFLFLMAMFTGSVVVGNKLTEAIDNGSINIGKFISTPASASELFQTKLMTATVKAPKKVLAAKPTELSGEQLISGFKNPQGNFTVTIPAQYVAFVTMDKGQFAGYDTESACGAVWVVGPGTYTGTTSYGAQYSHLNLWSYANVSASVVMSEAMKEAGPTRKSCDLFDLRAE